MVVWWLFDVLKCAASTNVSDGLCFFYCVYLDIPTIPDLDEVQEEDLTMQIAAPPW